MITMLRHILRLQLLECGVKVRLCRHSSFFASFGSSGNNNFSPSILENEGRSSYFQSHVVSLRTSANLRIRHFFTKSPLNNAHDARNCWKCGRDTSPEKELFFCHCGVVQRPANDLTLFELLKIEQGFDIDVQLLSQRFKGTQRKLHPDNFSTKSKEEQYFSEEQSSLLNKSYETLLKPLSRAIYLLELENITISENDSVTDPEFLMTMMEDFEAIDKASSPQEIKSVEHENEVKISECVKNLSKAFSTKDLVSAKNLTIQLRYFTTVQERIKDLRLKSFGL